MNVHRGREEERGLPLWLTCGVVIWLASMITYCVIRFGLDGYPMTMFFGGLLGAYAGVDRAVRRSRQNGQRPPGGDQS